jgi:hypothetical protein
MLIVMEQHEGLLVGVGRRVMSRTGYPSDTLPARDAGGWLGKPGEIAASVSEVERGRSNHLGIRSDSQKTPHSASQAKRTKVGR